LAGDAGSGKFVVAGLDGTPLGTDGDHPLGQDFSTTFNVDGYEGITTPGVTADDTPETAHDPRRPDHGRSRCNCIGAIGDDPFYNPNNSADPWSPDPIYSAGNDVDLYHFRITTAGRYALLAEVFAGQDRLAARPPGSASIGSIPTPIRSSSSPGTTTPPTPRRTTDLSALPLFADAMLTVALGPGDYYIAVSSGSNTPSPLEDMPPGTFGLFDPSISHSGEMGFGTGDYVLNLLVHAAPRTRRRSSTQTRSKGRPSTTRRPQLVVKIDVPVNLPQLAFQAFKANADVSLSSVFILAADGTRYFPRLIAYDNSTNQATFLMVDGLPQRGL